MPAKVITRVPEEEFAKMLEERVVPLSEKLEEISMKLTEKERKPREEKIEEIIAKIKAKQPEKIPEKIPKPPEEKPKPKEEVKDEHIHDDIDCPTCNKGHVHKMTSDGLTLKCTGDKCNEEFILMPKHADYVCDECGLPMKKPPEGNKIEGCPFCGNKKALLIENGIPSLKFDFTKKKK